MSLNEGLAFVPCICEFYVDLYNVLGQYFLETVANTLAMGRQIYIENVKTVAISSFNISLGLCYFLFRPPHPGVITLI